ncbi:hypothetical protein B7P43_G02088 [Cryptotermes secundus]|uniref:Ricin B lectin domain-containing protein n=2 Tax=Cryptotermes secundus TaxID=105785 RepID=A0A2J7QQV0_9NEOP|nr:uncharacterized protein LOC111865984 isoform X2 [Cryptotermes secundus]XP_023710202.1 uncharacterized protein LOC111865984 isoform X2 [Cryptotermes secundus]PNF30965.1 hypothetical protein B7P43_G02088 [Cryptotermes secundus]
MPFYIQNTETQLVLDVKGGEEGAEAQVIMFAYHGGANQLWEYKNGMIYSKLNGLVLDVNQETGNVSTFEPHGGPNQLWHFEEDGTIRSETDQVLDISEGSTEPGAPVIVFPKHGGPNQIFRTVTVDE